MLASCGSACGETAFPQRRFCTQCSIVHWHQVVAGPGGRLYTYTVVHELLSGLEGLGPHAVGQVDMEGGLRRRARARQVDGAAIGLCQMMGAGGVCVINGQRR